MITVTKRGFMDPFILWQCHSGNYSLYYKDRIFHGPTLYINAMRHSNWRRIV